MSANTFRLHLRDLEVRLIAAGFAFCTRCAAWRDAPAGSRCHCGSTLVVEPVEPDQTSRPVRLRHLGEMRLFLPPEARKN